MRNLQRNTRTLHYASILRTEPVLDEYGNDTLEVTTIYSPPASLKYNVSANVGQEAVAVFGPLTEYSRTVAITGDSCPLSEGCKVWFGVPVTEQHNYVVVKVADSKNTFLVALREVSRRA